MQKIIYLLLFLAMTVPSYAQFKILFVQTGQQLRTVKLVKLNR